MRDLCGGGAGFVRRGGLRGGEGGAGEAVRQGRQLAVRAARGGERVDEDRGGCRGLRDDGDRRGGLARSGGDDGAGPERGEGVRPEVQGQGGAGADDSPVGDDRSGRLAHGRSDRRRGDDEGVEGLRLHVQGGERGGGEEEPDRVYARGG